MTNVVGKTLQDETKKSLHQSGFAVIEKAFSPKQVFDARHLISAHANLLRQTRQNPSSLHLAGFHRYPELEPLHLLLSQNLLVNDLVTAAAGGPVRTIGLSDITVERSQEWHKDLLRGPFSKHLGSGWPCRDHNGTVFKVILYLQPSKSLKVINGSHTHDVSLESDLFAVPEPESSITEVHTNIGDVVVIDVCLTHRGSSEAAFSTHRDWNDKRILVSTVFGREGSFFTDEMAFGNAVRLQEWDRRNFER